VRSALSFSSAPRLTLSTRAVSAILWSVLYAHYGVVDTVKTIFSFIFLHFFALGLLISTSLW
jgi:hypothetical protein